MPTCVATRTSLVTLGSVVGSEQPYLLIPKIERQCWALSKTFHSLTTFSRLSRHHEQEFYAVLILS